MHLRTDGNEVKLIPENEVDRRLLAGFLNLDPFIKGYSDESCLALIDYLGDEESELTDMMNGLSEAVANDSFFDDPLKEDE